MYQISSVRIIKLIAHFGVDPSSPFCGCALVLAFVINNVVAKRKLFSKTVSKGSLEVPHVTEFALCRVCQDLECPRCLRCGAAQPDPMCYFLFLWVSSFPRRGFHSHASNDQAYSLRFTWVTQAVPVGCLEASSHKGAHVSMEAGHRGLGTRK